jgi:hypothetical protein
MNEKYWIETIQSAPQEIENATDWFVQNIKEAELMPFFVELSQYPTVPSFSWIYSILKRDSSYAEQCKPAIAQILTGMEKPKQKEKERIIRTLNLLSPILGNFTENAKRILEGNHSDLGNGKISESKWNAYRSIPVDHLGSQFLFKGKQNLETLLATAIDDGTMDFVMARFDKEVNDLRDDPSLDPSHQGWGTLRQRFYCK